MSQAVSITLDFAVPRELEANTNYHWGQRHAKVEAVQEATIARIRQILPRPEQFIEPVVVIYKLYWCGSKPDPDNLIYRMKPVLDCFVNEGILRDDGPDEIDAFLPRYERVPKRTQVKTVVQIRPSSA